MHKTTQDFGHTVPTITLIHYHHCFAHRMGTEFCTEKKEDNIMSKYHKNDAKDQKIMAI